MQNRCFQIFRLQNVKVFFEKRKKLQNKFTRLFPMVIYYFSKIRKNNTNLIKISHVIELNLSVSLN